MQIPIELWELSDWLHEVSSNPKRLLRQLRWCAARVARPRPRTQLACRFSIRPDADADVLSISVLRSAEEVEFGSVLVDCNRGRFFREYTVDVADGSTSKARQYFRNFDDAMAYLDFAERVSSGRSARPRDDGRRTRNSSGVTFSAYDEFHRGALLEQAGQYERHI